MKDKKNKKEEVWIKFNIIFNSFILVILTIGLFLGLYAFILLLKLPSIIPPEEFTNNLLFLLILAALVLIFGIVIGIPYIMNIFLEDLQDNLSKLTLKKGKKK